MDNKYITRDKLTDFVDKMWDAGKRVDLYPNKGYIAVSDASYNTEYINVFDKRTYDSLIAELTKKVESVDEQ